MSRILYPLLLALTSACSSFELAKAADQTGNGAPEDTGADPDTSADSAGPVYVPDAWVVRASLRIVDGLPVADGAAILIDLVDSSGDDESDEDDAGVVACTVTAELLGPDGAPVPDPVVYAWWSPIAVTSSGCADFTEAAGLPAEIGLGIGALHPDVRARLGADGEEDVADFLYGAYIDTGVELYAFGYAGSEANFAGEAAPGEALPDATYSVSPLYLLPLAGP